MKLDPGQALALIEDSGQPSEVIAHCKAVARYASELSDRLVAAGIPVDEDLLLSAALVHDIRRTSPDHAAAGAVYLEELGYTEVAALVAVHMDLPEGREQVLDEASLLYLADKSLQGTELVSLEERLSDHLTRGNVWAQHRMEQAITIRDLMDKVTK